MPNDTPTPAQIRKQLLSNGYTPLPLDGKACYIPGWTTAEVDEAWLEQYRRSARFKNTGIRCGRVLAVDIDVDDQFIADKIELLATDILGRSALCRFGKGEKRLLVYYIAEPITKRRTGKYLDGEREYQVEVLSRGQQFAAYGLHPDTGYPYEWPDRAPQDTDLDDLPEVTEAEVDEFVDAAEGYFKQQGYELSSKGHTGSEGAADYCLHGDSVFEVTTPPYGPMTVDAIKQQIGEATWQCNLTAIRPDSDSEAGRISMGPGGLRITDFVDMVTYYEAIDLDADGLADVLPDAPAATMFNSTGSETLDELLAEWAYIAADDTFRRLDDPVIGTKAPQFSKLYRGKAISQKTGREATVTNAFLDHSAATKCRYMSLRPDKPDDLVIAKGRDRILNTYRRPIHDIQGGESATFDEFMRHLIPRDAERDLVLDWIATKLQHPYLRMHALVMVAPKVYGTGRGTFYKVVSALIGEEYATKTSLAHLTGATTQSQYNDYLSSSLLVYIAEARDGSSDEGKATYYTRKHAYEQIKSVVETDAERELIVRKGVANITEKVWSSILISTNHADALAIEDGDRRLVMVSNGREIAPDLAERINVWRRNPANIAQVYGELMLRAPKYDPHGIPPMTPAKRFMLDASRSGIDEAWQLFAKAATGDICTIQQWRSYAHQMRAEHGLDFPDAHKVERALDRKINDETTPWLFDKRKQVKIDGRPYRPYIIRNEKDWAELDYGKEVSNEIKKNGPPDSVLLSLPPKKPPT